LADEAVSTVNYACVTENTGFISRGGSLGRLGDAPRSIFITLSINDDHHRLLVKKLGEAPRAFSSRRGDDLTVFHDDEGLGAVFVLTQSEDTTDEFSYYNWSPPEAPDKEFFVHALFGSCDVVG
jgi:hypothetical protein